MEITYVGNKQEENVQSLKIYYNHLRIWGILFLFRVVFIGRKQIEYSKINNIFQLTWEFKRFCLERCQPMRLDNPDQFSFLIQEKILLELKVCLQSAKPQEGLYSKVVM